MVFFLDVIDTGRVFIKKKGFIILLRCVTRGRGEGVVSKIAENSVT